MSETGGPADLSIEALEASFRSEGYVMSRPLATALFLSLQLEHPLVLEGEAGVGKTEVAKVLSRVLNTSLIRLQCYEGLDINNAVYEWNYPRQMLEIRLLEARGEAAGAQAADIFSEAFLIKRPLLQALAPTERVPVLLIDEIDRADEEFEAYLLELLSEYQITVPELGSIRAERPPHVILTSNRTREVHDALKRRCLYHWIEYPDFQKELDIVRTQLPGIDLALAKRIVEFVQVLRSIDLVKVPGIAETLDWARALTALGVGDLEPATVEETLGVIVKYEEDLRQVSGQLGSLLSSSARHGG